MRAIVRFLALLGFAVALPVFAHEQKGSVSSLVLEPVDAWGVTRSTTSCQLGRSFGSDKNLIQLIISRTAGPSGFDIALSGPGVPRLKSQQMVVVDGQPLMARGELLYATNARAAGVYGAGLTVFDLSAEIFAKVWSSKTLFLQYKPNKTISFTFSNEASALAALQSCHDDLLRSWGVDAARLALLAPLPNSGPTQKGANPGTVIAQRVDLPAQPVIPGSVVSSLDYPTAALMSELGGTVLMALSVDKAGHAESCRVISSSRVAVLDKTSCQLFTQRGVFIPSKDASGNAQPSTAVERIRWVIPTED